MNIPTSTILRDYKEAPIMDGKDELTLGMVISAALNKPEQQGSPMKAWELGKKAFNQKSLEVDTSDLALIKKAVESSDFFNMIKGQALVLLEEVKENKQEKTA